jgi:hypothetical protein
MRIKSTWFKPETPKSAAQTASAMAFIVWRVAQNALAQMRKADFDIDIGPQYFAFLREWLVFLMLVVDRWVHEQMNAEQRADFTVALVRRVAEVLAENEDNLLPAPDAGASDTAGSLGDFIDLYNLLAPHYAEFGHDENGPDFSFMRYLGHRIEALMPAKDRHWVVDQIVAIEAPQAVEMLKRSLQGVLSREPRPARRMAHTGD